jgi:hypothetical protein
MRFSGILQRHLLFPVWLSMWQGFQRRRFCSYSIYFESFDFEVKSLTLGGLIVIGSCLSGLFTGEIDDDFSGRMPGSVARNGIKQLVQGEDMGNRGAHLASGYKLRGLGQSRGGRLRPGE